MLLLRNEIRGYDWGSRDFIARVQGRPHPTAAPEAELWIGAHPDSPSMVEGYGRLDDLIRSAPAAYLGDRAIAQFGPRLPFLTKLLAAQEPLSIQAHPSSAQAEAGYAAGNVSYVDPYHKPEMLVALTPFEAFCGFREIPASIAALSALELASLDAVVDALRAGSLREAVRTIFDLSDPVHVVKEVADRHPTAAKLAGHHPGDLGVVVSLLLNHMNLAVGEAVWMPAGTLHSYIEGAGIETMAASDNVLRGGLTRKLINVPELMRVVRFTPIEPPILAPVTLSPGVEYWPVPVPDFRLHRIRLTGTLTSATVDPAGPRTIFCVSGRVTVADRAGELVLSGGESAFGAVTGGEITFTGSPAEVFLTSL
jgi:mannose-6-phosphate isomerase